MKNFTLILMILCMVSISAFGQSFDKFSNAEYDIGDQKTITSQTNPVVNSNLQNWNRTTEPDVANTTTNYIVKRGERPPIDIMAAPEDAYEKGILKIKFKESFTDQLDNNPVYLSESGSVVFNIASVDQLNEQFKAKGFKKLFECGAFTGEFEDRHRAWGFHLWYTLFFDEKADIKEMVLAYGDLDEVTIAEPQYRTELSNLPMPFPTETDKEGSQIPPTDAVSNDTHFGLQWHYHNTGQYSGTVDADIDLPEAWNIETGDPNVLVSIHDQGVQYTHPDLNLNFSGLSYDFYNDDPTISFGYHGTHVCGTVTAETNNSSGVAGVAGGWNSEGVNYMSAMVYLPGGGSGVGHHLAPVWAADNGACIEQNSWNYTSAGYYDAAVLDAIDYFNTNGGGTALSGGITIFSAGNHYNEGNYYPGCYSGTFSVAATNNQDEKSYYSTYGTWVDISAPGGETDVMDERGVYSTYTTNTYDYLQGTSMAAPHASGTAALIISLAYGQLTSNEVAEIIRNTTDDHYGVNPTYIGKLGTGRLNAYQALLETLTYLVTPGTMMPIPAQSSTFTGNVRGYWFTAPTNFTITGLRVPLDIAGNQTIEIIRFNSGPPPVYSGTTNDFVSLGRWVNVAGSGIISCNISVENGDIIGILGCRGTTTSYGSNNYVTNIDGHSVTLVRMGMQHELPSYVAQDVWQEPASTALGRIEMYYETYSTWTGNVSTDWNNANNWMGLFIPGVNNEVVIPSGCPNYPVLSGNLGINTASYTYDCKSLTVNSGATLSITAADIYSYGNLTVAGTVNVGDDFFLYSGSTTNLSGTIQIGTTTGWYGEAYHYSGSIFNQTGGNYNTEGIHLSNGSQFNGNGGYTHIYVNGDAPASMYIEIDDPDSYFYYFQVDVGATAELYSCSYDLQVNQNTKPFGPLNIGSYMLNTTYMDAYSTVTINSGGTVNVSNNGPYFHDGSSLIMSPGAVLNTAGNIQFQVGSTENVTGGEIFIEDNFHDLGEFFSPIGGSVTFDGATASIIYGPTTFYDLNINKTSLGVTSNSAFSITNNLVINSGVLNPANYTIDIGGTWTNNVGLAGFTEGTGRVIFNKPTVGVQYINTDEHFHILECATASAISGIRPASNADVSCNIYDWTSGGVSTSGSTFTAYDLADNSLYGFFYAHSNSQIILTELTSYIDLYGDLLVRDNALIQINGGADESYWATTGTADVTVETGGVLDFVDMGIHIWNTGTLTYDIQAGSTIKVGQDFLCDRTDFIPAGGVLEFQNGNSAYFSVATGSALYDVLINKTGGDNSTYQTKDRDGNSVEYTKANTVTLWGNATINNVLTVDNGELILNGYALSVKDKCDVYGTLSMTNAADVLTVGTGGLDNLSFFPGSIGNLANGNVNLYAWVVPHEGCSFTASTNNYINFVGANTNGGLSNMEPSAVYGNVVVNKTANRIYIDALATEPIILNGNFTLNPNNTIEMQFGSMIVHGYVDDDPTSTIYAYNAAKSSESGPDANMSSDEISELKSGAKDGYLEIDNNFTLNGLLDVGDGEVLLHGNFGIANTGSLLIDGGSFIADAPYHAKGWDYLYGNLSMTSGHFEITNNSTRFEATATTSISGGLFRTGGAFYATDPGVFQPSGGVVEIIGDNSDVNIYCNGGNYFNNLVINRAAGYYCDFEPLTTDEVIIMNDLTINSGLLRQHVINVFVGGNWTNNVGESAFEEGTGTVTFNGTGDVDINNNETFYNLTLSKVNSADWLTPLGDITVLNNLTINPGALYTGNHDLSVAGNVAVNSGGVLYIQAGATLGVGNAKSLNVNNGGWLYVVGNASNYATVTHNTTGTYAFNILSGGHIGAQYAIFEFMNGNGVFAQVGSDIHSSYTFNNCIFRNGAPSPSALLALSNNETFTCNNAYFENASGLTQYNVWKNNSEGQATFYNATGAFAGEPYDYDPYNNVDWLNDGYTVNGTVTYAYGVTPLNNVTVNLMDGATLVDQAITNTSGYYEFTDVADGNYTLVSTCSLPYTYVTTLSDVNAVVSHILGTPLTGLLYLAGEVSGDGVVTLADYNLMVSNLLGTLSGYPAVPGWRFEDHNVIVSGGNETINFGGIMSGDATGTGM